MTPGRPHAPDASGTAEIGRMIGKHLDELDPIR